MLKTLQTGSSTALAQNDWTNAWNSVFRCFGLWELPARIAYLLHFKRRAPLKSDRKTQREPQNLTRMVFQQLGAVLGPMFSIVGGWLAGGWLADVYVVTIGTTCTNTCIYERVLDANSLLVDAFLFFRFKPSAWVLHCGLFFTTCS